jgi:hypothetical protein
MYKNINYSSSYLLSEQFKNEKPVSTKFGKDKKAYNKNQNQMKKMNKKNVNLNKVKIDRDTSIKKPNPFTPKKIKKIGNIMKWVIIVVVIIRIVLTTIQLQIVMPIIFCILSILYISIILIGKEKVFKALKLGAKAAKYVAKKTIV